MCYYPVLFDDLQSDDDDDNAACDDGEPIHIRVTTRALYVVLVCI